MAYASQTALNNEIAARKAADAALQDQISALRAQVAALTPPVITPSPTVTVKSIADLYAALSANQPDITLAPGAYTGDVIVDSRFAGRTSPGVVRCSGAVLGGCLRHIGGSHDLTWLNPSFANFSVSQTGVILFGGYAGQQAPHGIHIVGATVQSSVHRTAAANTTTDHAVYFSYALDTWGDILIDGLTVEATDAMGLSSGIHMDHGYAGDAPNVPAHGVTVRNLTFHGNSAISGQQAIILWQPPIRDWLFDGAVIQNAGGQAVRFESIGASNIVFRGVTSTNSHGFYSSLGKTPPGVAFDNCSLA